MSTLRQLLHQYRKEAKTEREKGTYFEILVKNVLEKARVYESQFSKVQSYATWAQEHGEDATDIGIDLVATPQNANGFCAVQCKFYKADYAIQKSDIDSFFTASGKEGFTRRIIVDSTEVDWSKNAIKALDGQQIPTSRITINDLEASGIDWSVYGQQQEIKLNAKKSLRPHQQAALDAVQKGLAENDRGKLIMACGTGKTFTSLKIAEALAGVGKRVLYLVPSLALMSQTVREWSNDAEVALQSFAVCSDSHVGKRIKDDVADINVHDLVYPATTNSTKLTREISQQHQENRMTVVFSTYQSIQVIADAQKQGMATFDLIICDEAHRTTGATLAGEEDSNFVKVHSNDYVQAHKRLYMTATPRIFEGEVKDKANDVDALLCSMDDEALYGETLYEVSFGYAVENNLLTDYKVVVLAVDEAQISSAVQKRLADEDAELNLDDVTKMVGCYKALIKSNLASAEVVDTSPMNRAVAFCKNIKSSKLFSKEFTAVVEEYLNSEEADEDDSAQRLYCDVRHVDGTFNAKKRNQELEWLSQSLDSESCHILSNARCLSEGVDVPALDAIIFMHPRKSQVDVVQSVGRVMRRAKGKKLGYVILPVAIPAGLTPEQALNQNERYKVVWQILNALRSHDERLDATVNRIKFGEDVSDKIEIIATAKSLPQPKSHKQSQNIGKGNATGDEVWESSNVKINNRLLPQPAFQFDEFQKAIRARIVKKCGTRDYWENWAKDIADIAQKHITRIQSLLQQSDSKAKMYFDTFLAEIRDDLNESISEEDAIEMLAQHLITKPVFESLFKDYSFVEHNPVSQAMEKVLAELEANQIDNEAQSLEKFYASVKRRASSIQNDEGKQKIVVELYDKFFRNAFPRLTEKLGIVYTPVEVVDFIIHSVNDVLQREFGQTLGSQGVHILDPFTGTGTFITRLLQSGLIKPEELAHKYKHEIHANEIVLLAYYIAAINIEASYHSLQGGAYTPFPGICLTDTFQLYEKQDYISEVLEDNSNRRKQQKALDIRIIMGNPPYSAGQSSANDNNANVKYPSLDSRIEKTYVKYSTAVNKNALYDSYIRAFRWASDRIQDHGVVAFVTNAGWIDRQAMDGMRKCLVEEFSNLYIFHLRGDARTSGEQRRKEKDNVFGQGTRTPVAIALMVKTSNKSEYGNIHFYNIGDYLKREEKLAIIENFSSIQGITEAKGWQQLIPDKHYDWLNQRDDSFKAYIPIGDKKNKDGITVFENYSAGVKTNRDAWCYNFSKYELEKNMRSTLDFFNQEVDRYAASATIPNNTAIKDFISNDSTKITWDRPQRRWVKTGQKLSYEHQSLITSLYRPFTKAWLYYNRDFNNCVYQMPKIFPSSKFINKVICVSGKGGRNQFSTLIVNTLPDVQFTSNGQCFPLYLYEKSENKAGGLFSDKNNPDKYTRKDAITDIALKHFQTAYPEATICKEDIFYYIYGLSTRQYNEGVEKKATSP